MDKATVTATANKGYHFVGWYDGATLISNSTLCRFTITKNMTLVAKFAKDNTYLVTARSLPATAITSINR